MSKTSHVRWFLVFWLFVLSAVSYLDRVQHLGCRAFDRRGIRAEQCAIGLRVQRDADRIRAISDGRRTTR